MLLGAGFVAPRQVSLVNAENVLHCSELNAIPCVNELLSGCLL